MMLQHILITIVCCVLQTLSSYAAAPCIKVGTIEHCYKIVDTSITWTQASRICKGDGGMLIIIESVEEQNFIADQMTERKFTVNGLWIGSNNLNPEAKRTWTNGNKFTYQNWAIGEPRDNEDVVYENCAEISTDNMKWKGQTCSDKRGYICENTHDCYTETTTYTGQQSVTNNGRICQAWSLNKPHSHTYHNDSMFADGKEDTAANYCRDPGRDGYLWCYTVDLAKRLEKCPVWSCNVTARDEPCIEDETTGQCYQMVDTDITWNQASYLCNRDGGTLAIIESAREQQFVGGIIQNRTFNASALWIGSDKLHPEQQRTWVNGEKLSYVNWEQGQPNGLSYDENCAELYTFDSKWNDNSCAELRGYICENSRSAKQYIQDNATGRWYKLANELTTWTKAFDICKSEGGMLMIIETVEEQNFIRSKIEKIRFDASGLWIGSNSLHPKINRTWTNGMSFAYANWAEGEPNSSPHVENCAEISVSNSQWNDMSCTYRRGYICEKTLTSSYTIFITTTYAVVIGFAVGWALVFLVGVLYCLIQKRTKCKKKKDEGYQDVHNMAMNQAEHVYQQSSGLDDNYCTIDDNV